MKIIISICAGVFLFFVLSALYILHKDGHLPSYKRSGPKNPFRF